MSVGARKDRISLLDWKKVHQMPKSKHMPISAQDCQWRNPLAVITRIVIALTRLHPNAFLLTHG